MEIEESQKPVFSSKLSMFLPSSNIGRVQQSIKILLATNSGQSGRPPTIQK